MGGPKIRHLSGPIFRGAEDLLLLLKSTILISENLDHLFSCLCMDLSDDLQLPTFENSGHSNLP